MNMLLFLCISIVCLQLLTAMGLILLTRTNYKIPKQNSVNQITILIPFHNEEKRINKLIRSLNKAKPTSNFELIFINDHSSDKTVNLLMKRLTILHQLIPNSGKKGKKYAVLEGVKLAGNPFILTWDADISFSKKYLSYLSTLPLADLVILPVQMRSKTWIGKLSAIEFSFMQSLGFGAAALKNPVFCYGPNLIFSKASFLEVNPKRSDYEIPSGDDMFLLKAMLSEKKSVLAYSNSRLSVKTDAPSSLEAIVQQRKRWFGKMGSLLQPITSFSLILLISVQFVCLISLGLVWMEPLFLIPLAIKLFAELIASGSFIFQKPLHVLVLLVHQIWYPFYLIRLLFPASPEKRWETIDNE